MPSFEDNLNFIFNTNYKHGSDFWITKIDCINTISILKSKIPKLTAIIQKINHIHGEQLINKSLKNLYNLEKVLKNFEKKINKAPQTIAFAHTEANKLLEEYQRPQNTNNNLELKSSILIDKIKFLYTELYTIKAILNLIKKELGTIEIQNNHIEIPLDSLCNKIKKCLKETEEYNISKLKRAQQQFEKSKELNDFMYGKRNPKLAHLLSLDSAVPVDADVVDKKTNKVIKRAIPSKLMTPFGPVWVKRSSSDHSRMIYLIYLNQQCSKDLKYDEMCKELDWKFNSNFNSEIKDLYRKRAIEGIIKPIIKYISQPLTKSQNTTSKYGNIIMQQIMLSTVKYNYPISRYLTKSQKEAAAFLCGVLLLSESHEFRNPTGGKFERKAMKNVLRLAKNGCLNPFSKVFSNAKGRYIPAQSKQTHGQGNQLDNPLPGGQRIASMIIDSNSINVRFLCTKSEYTQKSFEKFRNKAETDYTNEAKKILLKKTYGNNNNLWEQNQKLFQSAKEDGIMGKTTKKKLGNEFVTDPEVIECYKGFGFINWLKNAKENDKFDIDQLPDTPKESIISQIKILIKGKNLKRLNKLMSNMI